MRAMAFTRAYGPRALLYMCEWHRAAAETFRRGGYLDPVDGCVVMHIGCSLQVVGIRFNVETGSSPA